ncbi:MAG TPA: PBP1A family penicillin-binding protein [Bacillota bacterium]|nr:PBP1A family penicillin-binding protein [Bacillota bacterium]
MPHNGQSRMARRKQKQKISKKKPFWKKLLLSIAVVFLLAGIGVGGVFAYYIATAPKLDEALLNDPFSSKFFDKDGNSFAELGAEQRTKIEYDDLPPVLIDAVIATEDSRFFDHPGIDLQRIGGAIVANFKRGFGAEGASTITQQVVEKSFLSPEKSIELKVQEQWLALRLERKYSKEEILEMYLNKIFYGSGAYGVAKASQIYFGKTDLNELTLPEAAILAGLPQRPTAYNPFENPDLTKKRMKTVLELMVRHNKISEQEAKEAMEIDIESLLVESRPESTEYEAFLQQVDREIKEKVNGADIYTDGLKVYTTLDTSVQDHVEFLLTDSDDNPIPYPDSEMQAGMTVLDTSTGAIRAIGGRRNSEGVDEYNFAIQGGQQPGSTFKPIVAYAPAIEYNKWSTYHQINDDKPYEVGGTNPIRNWNRQYQGWMSARYALTHSLNVPTVKTLEETGLDQAKEFAEGLGIEFANDKIDIRDAIGGTETVTTPLQLAGAYRAFGNEGIYNEPYAVTKVEFPDGKVVDLKPEPEAAMSDYTAYMITDMLKSVMDEGTGREANIPDLPVAGKTGTTNLQDQSGSPDSWFAGYTTNYTISIWTGYPEERKPLPNTKIPHALFTNTMTEISKDIETKDFTKPDSVVELPIINGSNPPAVASRNSEGGVVNELFVKGHEPNQQPRESVDQLDPVNSLKASFDEDTESIHVDWKYDKGADVFFEISASIDGGSMKLLSSTEDTSMDMTEVDPEKDYTIQVVAVSNKDDSLKSKPATTKVKMPGKDDEDKDDDEEKLGSVSNLNAKYVADSSIIDVAWDYNGPPASFEVSVNGQVQTVDSQGIEISGAQPGETYKITVTPVGKQGANQGVKGDPTSTSVQIPDQNENEEPDQEPEPDENEDQEEQNDEQEPEEDQGDGEQEEEPNEPEEPEDDAEDEGEEDNETEDEQEDDTDQEDEN